MSQTPLDRRETPSPVETQIAFVLNHPHMSDWIKQTLRGALAHPPVQVLNDLEILNHILRARADLPIAETEGETAERGKTAL